MKLLILLVASVCLFSNVNATNSPGLFYKYYEGTWNQLPDFNALTPLKTGTASNVDLNVRNVDQSFGIMWQGYITIPAAGNYTFETNSDDGSQLYINNSTTPLVNNDNAHPATTISGTQFFNAGTYPVKITFFQNTGGQLIELYWSSNTGIVRQRIPDKAFSTTVNASEGLKGNTNYYFSSVNGDDSRTSSQAQNQATPWKTLQKLNSIFPGLQPGDAILFNRGETFPGNIVISNSGTQSLPIIISSYGTGDKPVITGMKTLTQWTAVGTNVYESPLNSNKYLDMVTVNDAATAIGRWPNLTDANKGYLTIDGSTKTVDANGNYTGGTITDAALSGSPDWTGAQAVIRKRHWVLDRCRITGQSGSSLTYLTPSVHDVIDGWGYFIQNSAATLDKQGEWYYNPAAKTLRIYSTVDPSTLSVKAAVVDTLVYLNNRSFITFDNVSFQGSDTVALKIENNSSHISIQNCDFNFAGMRGIVANSSSYILVENCFINNTYSESMLFTNCSNTSIKNNNIKNNCMKAGMSEDFNATAAIYMVHESNGLIEYNTLDSLGSSGIAFMGENVIVQNNFVNHFTMVIDDGAGIYTWTGGVPGEIIHGRIIRNNIVINGLGSPEGTETTVANATNGIYTDDISQNIEITGNTSANVSRAGLFLHNAQNIQIRNNTFFNNTAAQILMTHDGNGYVDATVNGQVVSQEYSIKNIEIRNNILFAKTEAQPVLSQVNIISSDMAYGSYDSNYYSKPINKSGILNTNYANGSGGNVNTNYELEGWANKFSLDKNSKNSPVSLVPYKITNVNGTNKFTNATFQSNALGVESENTVTWANKIDGGSVQINSTSKTSNLAQANMSLGSVVAGTSYLIRFTVQGSTNTESIGASIRRWGGDYANVSDVKSFKLGTARTECEFIFTAATNEQEVKLTIFATESVTPFWFDNIAVTPVTVTMTNPNDSLRFEYNASTVVKTISLEGTYIDAKNNKFTNQVSLDPFTSIVLTKVTVETQPDQSAFLRTGVVDSDNTGTQELAVYPNPVANMLSTKYRHEGTGKIRLAIYNLNGVVIKSAEYEKTEVLFEKNIDVSSLLTGVYYIEYKLSDGGSSSIKPFVKH